MPNLSNIFIWLNAVFLLFGLFQLGWEPEVILLVYFLETIIIGILHVAKLFTVYRFGRLQQQQTGARSAMTGGAAIPFFLLHYFFFVFVQSTFIFTFLEGRFKGIDHAFNVFANYQAILSEPDILTAFLGLFISHVAYNLKNFFLPRRYHIVTVKRLFMQPYLRVFVQQFVTILSGFFFIFTGGLLFAALLLIGLRLVIDLYLNAAAQSEAFKQKLVKKLSRGKGQADIRQTDDSFSAFLEP